MFDRPSFKIIAWSFSSYMGPPIIFKLRKANMFATTMLIVLMKLAIIDVNVILDMLVMDTYA